MVVLLPAFITLLLMHFAVSGESCGPSPGQVEKECLAAKETLKTPITIQVTNSVNPGSTQTYSTYVANGGILLGGMIRLQETTDNFSFTYTMYLDHGPFLASVNGLAGCTVNHTYWQLLLQKPDGTVTPLNVGIGCYIPSANDVIILKYTQY